MKQWQRDIITILESALSFIILAALVIAFCWCLPKVADWAFTKGEKKDQPTAAQLRRQTDIINMRHLREPMNAMEINALMDAPKVRSIKEGTR